MLNNAKFDAAKGKTIPEKLGCIEIGDNVFIGCNTNLVAPVVIHNNSFIACGSTITADVPENTLAIARSRQLNKIDYYK